MARRKSKKQSTGAALKIWLIALYIRLSKEDGNDESLSVANQRKILLEYVEKYFTEEYVLVDVYVDDGNTGTDTNRPEFMRMKQDIKDGKINCVMVKSLARAFRNNADQSKFLEEFLPIYNVRFVNLGNPFIDTYNDPRLGLEVPIHGMFNEQFAAQTSEEVRKTFNMKRRQGEFIGAFAKYGYKKDPDNKNQLLVDEVPASVIRDIDTWLLYGIEKNGVNNGGMSIRGITKELNERGVPCPAKYKREQGLKYYNPHNVFDDCYWTEPTVSRILKDISYTGCLVQGKQRIISYKIHKQIQTPEEEWFVVPDAIPAIRSKETQEMILKRLERDTRTAPGKKEVYLFSGFIHCADCGRALHRKTSRNNTYYYCRIQKVADNACTKRSINVKVLEEVTLKAIQLQISMVDELSKAVDEVNKSPLKNNQSERLNALLKNQEKELIRLTKITDSLYGDYRSELITQDEYLRMKKDYTVRIDELNQSIAKIKADCRVYENGITSEHAYFKAFKKHKNIRQLRHDVLTDLVDKILLHADGQVTIQFKFTNIYQQIVDYIENNKIQLTVIKNSNTA